MYLGTSILFVLYLTEYYVRHGYMYEDLIHY